MCLPPPLEPKLCSPGCGPGAQRQNTALVWEKARPFCSPGPSPERRPPEASPTLALCSPEAHSSTTGFSPGLPLKLFLQQTQTSFLEHTVDLLRPPLGSVPLLVEPDHILQDTGTPRAPQRQSGGCWETHLSLDASLDQSHLMPWLRFL